MKERRFGPILFLPGENGGRYPFCHSIYIESGGVLIDPASDRDRLARLSQCGSVREVWLSHWHEDHFRHLDLFDGLPLRISQTDAPPLSDLDLFLDWYGLDDPDFRDFWRKTLLQEFHFRPRKPTSFLRGGDDIHLGEVTVEVIHTPGHTSGHLAFFFKEERVLFMGDYDLTRFGPWYGDSSSSIEETLSSIERLKEVPAKVWVTSHETGVFEADPGILWDQYVQVIEEREEKLLTFLKKPRTLEEVVEAWIVYRRPREPKAFFAFGEKAIMTKHLGRLLEEGVLARDGSRFYRR
jgi:glyoxylase-like metal-dependent hydrolase (beta-lactamase superfamily II)